MRPVALRQIKPACQNLLSYVSQETLAISVISSRKFFFLHFAGTQISFRGKKKNSLEREREREKEVRKKRKEGI